MRISDWSSDVCSSDLYGDVHILELHRQRIGPAILLAFDRRQFPAARALPPRPRMLPQRRRHGALQGRGRIMPGTIGRSVRMPPPRFPVAVMPRSEEHTSELQSLMRISYAVFCLKKKK